jgi:type IV pilus assembly protein PilA
MLARLRSRPASRDEGGYSLVELLIVIVILGILAAIAIPIFFGDQKKSYDAGLKTDLRTVANEVTSQNVTNENFTKTTWKTAGTTAAANATISGTGLVVGDSSSVSLTPGDTITWIGATTTSFCVMASNPEASIPWYYSSSGGGITSTACTN